MKSILMHYRQRKVDRLKGKDAIWVLRQNCRVPVLVMVGYLEEMVIYVHFIASQKQNAYSDGYVYPSVTRSNSWAAVNI